MSSCARDSTWEWVSSTPVGKIARTVTPLILLLFAMHAAPARPAVRSAAEEGLIYLPLVNRNAQRVAWIGPDGGTITALAIDPQAPEVIYAGTWGAGVFKSMDGGENWVSYSRGLGNLYINSLAVDPQNSKVLYAGTYKGKLYKSSDGGAAWSLSSQGVQAEAIVYAIAINPLDTRQVYIATRGLSNQGAPPWNGVVYKSDDAGETWSPSLTDVGGATLKDWMYSLSIHPKAPNIIYAAAHEQGPYRSMDGGVSWEVVENGISDHSGRAIAVDPHSSVPAVAYFGVWHGGGVFRTGDGGETWLQVSQGLFGNKVFGIAIDPLETSTLYLGTFTAGVVKSLDSGEAWFSSGLYDKEIFTLAVNPGQAQIVYAGTVGSGLYRSLAAGVGWELSQRGLKGSPLTSLIASELSPQTYYASSLENGVVMSADHGKTWGSFSSGLPERAVNQLVEHPKNPAVLYALTGSSGLYRCDLNGGGCWVPLGEGLPTTGDMLSSAGELARAYPDFFAVPFNTDQVTAYASLLAMTFAPANDAVLYVGTAGFGVYKSLDGGAHWVSAGLLGENVHALAVDLEDPQKIYAAAEGVNGLLYSQNGGSDWTQAGLPEHIVSNILIPENTPGTIYAATEDGIYRQAGSGWAQSGLSGSNAYALAAHAHIPGLIFAGTDQGGYLSWDRGKNWYLASPELAGTPVHSVRIDPSDPQMVYFVTDTRGILRLRLPTLP